MVSGTTLTQNGLGRPDQGRDKDNYFPPTAFFREVFLHEVRPPLSVARQVLELLRDSVDTSAGDVGRLMGWLEHSLIWLQHLVESIPTWVALLNGEVILNRRLITIRDWVEPALNLVQPLLACKEQQLRYICGVPAAPVWGDPRWLQQAVINLLTNAIRHGPRGDTIEVVVHPGRTKVEVRVTDHGPGISPRQAQQLFRPYVTSQAESGGKGLGLYIVRRVAELHGGSVGVSSRPGEATTFRIVLPAAGYEPPTAGVPTAQNDRRL